MPINGGESLRKAIIYGAWKKFGYRIVVGLGFAQMQKDLKARK